MTGDNKQDEYQQIVNESIDELNASQSFDGTNLKKEHVVVQKTVYSKRWFAIVCLLLVLNICLTLYFNMQDSRITLTPEEVVKLIKSQEIGEESKEASIFAADEIVQAVDSKPGSAEKRLKRLTEFMAGE